MNVSLQTASERPVMGLIALSQMCEAPVTSLEGWIQPISSTPTPLPLPCHRQCWDIDFPSTSQLEFLSPAV